MVKIKSKGVGCRHLNKYTGEGNKKRVINPLTVLRAFFALQDAIDDDDDDDDEDEDDEEEEEEEEEQEQEQEEEEEEEEEEDDDDDCYFKLTRRFFKIKSAQHVFFKLEDTLVVLILSYILRLPPV
ncbi:jg235 [Pararge aegeria aegeria]|uniref:Jg235 protein n=1 Tax=Pararge aegeria aegeria TaxID=348720 RepID=A0A8S4QTI2_9NEOP|nr:jg235 [Pararge aegeria aegeria]